MNKTIILLIFIFPCMIFSQSDFNNGYKTGYKAGYCYEQGVGCIPPIPPIPPIPRIGENTYKDGYNRGFSDGKSKRSSISSNSNSSTRTGTVSTSSYTPLTMEEIMLLSRARKQNGGSDDNLIVDLILLPLKMLIDWDEISISPVYALSKPNNKSYKNGYGVNIDGRFRDNSVDFVYGYSFIQYEQIENNVKNLKQHSINIGIGINLLKDRNIQMELTPLLEYELNNQSSFGYGGYLGIKKTFFNKKLSIGSRYRYTTISNQLSLNLIYTK